MAALSFSPSPPPPLPKNGARNESASKENPNANSNSNSNSNANSNSNNSRSAVTPLGASSKSFGKITVHNVLSESGANTLLQQHINNQNTIIRKIKDFGMLGAAAAATAARPLNANKSPNEENKQQPAVGQLKRSKLSKKTSKSSTPGRKGLPLPQAVARRNARERNRVKQVNNGFAALRERIPDEVSEAFEAQGAGRGASKKLSKVETLRMAVEYIRSLEKLLGFDFPPLGCHSNSSSSGDDSFMFIKDEFDGLDEHFDDSLSNYELEEPQQQQHQLLLLPNVTTLNGLQYIRIAGTSTYQLLTPDMLPDSSSLADEDEEQFNALIDDSNNCPAAIADGVAAAATAATASNDSNNNNNNQSLLLTSKHNASNNNNNNTRHILPPFYDQETVSIYDNIVAGLPSFKKEFSDVLQDHSTSTAHNVSVCLSDESMIDAIDWWEAAHTPKSDASTVAGI
ncbi:uncharacterized protein Dmoj_GI11000 [Drosophila mojavensis]|uniref:BHLH domain-containing protein n=1 Tax=Drosophila mojavensis TaxID=7230 RepID=B4L828_DROMO|nr:uncharacterized protein Dmoj_GI11000 [Drosophila mojavensis]